MAVVPRPAGAHADLLGELLARVEEYEPDADRTLVADAFAFAEERHAGQVRKSGEPYIVHPAAVALICAELQQPPTVLAAALLHDVVEDTETAADEIGQRFGADVQLLVEGVTKLSRIHFSSREEADAENYRKMVLSMAADIRVVLVKLADRLHNMRTLAPLGKQKQIQIARETLEVYAPIAHRLGISSLKSELEDLAFATLHPRKFAEIAAMVSERRADRDLYVSEAGEQLARHLEEVDITAQISGRAKHLYSIFEKMSRRGKEFNEIYDLTAMRVLVGDEKDCYGAIGIIHSLWKPMPGRFKDYVAMPKTNGYQSLHTTVIGPQGTPLEIQVRTQRMHQTAEFGVAAHWLYKDPNRASHTRLEWLEEVADAAGGGDASVFMEALRAGLFDDEVYVFTPKGELKALAAGATPLDFAYAVHTDVGHRCVGAKVNGRIVPLSATLGSGDIVEILTAKADRGPSRDWLKTVRTNRAREKIRAYFAREQREDTEQKGRDALHQALRSAGLPHQKLAASPLLAAVIRELGFKRASEFYVAIGAGKVQVSQVTQSILKGLTTQEIVEPSTDALIRRGRRGPVEAGRRYGVVIEGLASDAEVLVRMARCCTPVPGDEIVGYISVGRGVTIHRGDCANVRALRRTPERFTAVAWSGDATASFRVTLALEAWDRPRLLEDIGRTFAEHGCNVVEYGGVVAEGVCRNWYTVEIGDVKTLRAVLAGLRGVDAVIDAYRVTPEAAR